MKYNIYVHTMRKRNETYILQNFLNSAKENIVETTNLYGEVVHVISENAKGLSAEVQALIYPLSTHC